MPIFIGRTIADPETDRLQALATEVAEAYQASGAVTRNAIQVAFNERGLDIVTYPSA